MKKFTSQLSIIKLCLMSFIVICSVFATKNAYSRAWQTKNMEITYNTIDRIITFEFPFYDYLSKHKEHSFMEECTLKYSYDGINYNNLIDGRTSSQNITNVMWMHITNIRTGANIDFLNSYQANKEEMPKAGILVGMKMELQRYKYNRTWVNSKCAKMSIQWSLYESVKHIKFIKIDAIWTVSATGQPKYRHTIREIYKQDNVNSKSNEMNNDGKVLKQEISDIVKTRKNANGILVTGAKHGQNIQVYTISGAEVKSVVANDDNVNIKLPKNETYFIKAGHANSKIAL